MPRQKLRYSGIPNHDLTEVPEQKLLAATEVVPKNLNPSWERVHVSLDPSKKVIRHLASTHDLNPIRILKGTP